MTATGLLPWQSWAIAPGPTWQARIGRDGRAHCIGRELANDPNYRLIYTDQGMWPNLSRVFYQDRGDSGRTLDAQYRRPWHTFERACRAARMHSRMVIAAKRNAAQAGQNGSGQ